MEHVVFFTGADGGAQFRRVATLEEAVRYVEHLRNDGGVEDPRVFALTEVPLAFKAVYRVEVPGLPEAPVVEEPVPAVVADAEPVAEPVAETEPVAEPEAEPEPEPVAVAAVPEPFAAEVFPAQPEPASNGKGGRGLGFFTR